MVTGSGEARGMGYWAETQVKGLSQCNEAICRSCECKSHHRSSQFGNNTCRGKELAVELLGQRHIHRTKRWIKDGSKTGFITYPVNNMEVLLKSRMRENLKSGSVMGLIAASGRRWL